MDEKQIKVHRMGGVRSAGGALAVLLVTTVAAPAGFSTTVDDGLRTAKEIYVATQRRDGTRSKAAPVWFMYDQGTVFFSTKTSSYKARRLRNGGPVYVSVGSPDGPAFEGHGTLVSDPDLIDRMAVHYRKKYWIAWLGLFVPNKGRVAAGKTTIVKVTPAKERGE